MPPGGRRSGSQATSLHRQAKKRVADQGDAERKTCRMPKSINNNRNARQSNAEGKPTGGAAQGKYGSMTTRKDRLSASARQKMGK